MKLAYLFSLGLVLSVCSSTALAASCESIEEKAQVSAVYPTADNLPENLLRFYIYFSQPMQRQDILSSVYLADSDGNKVEGVFLENRFDLWSPDSSRLTLLFDPGRVKTGLVAHNAMGRALIPGNDYQLIVETSTKDSQGCNLARQFHKTFKATAADYDVPDLNLWNISQPKQGSSEVLTIDLNGKMDHVSLAYRIRVTDSEGQTVVGKIELAQQEQQWMFIPDHPWNQNLYQVVVDPRLEDVAGNRLTGLFDQPSLAEESAGQQQWITIPLPL